MPFRKRYPALGRFVRVYARHVPGQPHHRTRHQPGEQGGDNAANRQRPQQAGAGVDRRARKKALRQLIRRQDNFKLAQRPISIRAAGQRQDIAGDVAE